MTSRLPVYATLLVAGFDALGYAPRHKTLMENLDL